jgi:signal peptide peptidase SppA
MSKQLASTVITGLNNQAVLLAPSYVDQLGDNLRMITAANQRDENEESASNRAQMVAAYGLAENEHSKPFAYIDGIAFIPVSGILINRFNYSWSFITGYNFIRSMMQAALADDDVKLIVYDVNSGGGQVAGCFELCDDIYASREIKPSLALVDAFCYSAAYAIGSSASKVVVTPSGGVGSIGALMMHVDYSKAMDDFGVKITYIYSGDHKVDGNSYEKLPTKVKAAMQEDIDFTRKEFVTLVARNRGIEYQTVYDTEAECYRPAEALALGLIDAVQPPSAALLTFFNELSGSQSTQEINMSNTTEKTAPNAASAAEVSETEKTAQATQKAAADARTEERTRISAITTCDEAKDKPKLAAHLAMNTEMTAEAAKGILAASASEVVAAPAEAAKPSEKAEVNLLDGAMDATNGGAGVKAEGEADGATAEVSGAQRIINAQNAATGQTLKLH